MRIFVAGATGAVGRLLVPMLVERGHQVAGTTRSPEKADGLTAAGAEPVVLDALDRDRVVTAAADFKPEVIVHQLTAIGALDMRRIDRGFAATNRLRTEGTDNLIAAARASGARRLVAQSFAGWPYARTGGPVKTEADPLDEHPPANARQTIGAIRHLEQAVTAAAPVEGVVLRYGGLYGPHNALGRYADPDGTTRDGDMLAMVRKRRFPVVGSGAGHWSFLHIEDAARAAVLAAEGGPAGIYNIVDDEPVQVREFLPYLAQVLGVRSPMRVPAWLVRPVLGEFVVNMMTDARGASNAKARRDLGFMPAWPTWREGFRTGLG
ncbi:MAG: NAD(P)-dependent oxidoreductase [Micromonosporaceae bacterium]|nr:NAD(P)-dependent oxidoreductase [Micromonosporaceae bacterium]